MATTDGRTTTMNAPVTAEAERALADIADRFRLSQQSVLTMLLAVQAGGGTMAQFNIPELGGSGQWMRGGMTMVGDMFDHTLKARVDALCAELAQLVLTTTVFPAAAPPSNWWPAELGVPSSVGGQNDARYAVFPSTHRLVVESGGATRVYDTAEHRISGVQQQQGDRGGTVTFSSQFGTFDVGSLHELGAHQPVDPAVPPDEAYTPTHARTAAAPGEAPNEMTAVIAAIGSLADLHRRGIVSDEEFAAKKTELLARL